MNHHNETWTLANDLALVYIALAYGTDQELSDSELDLIVKTLKGWFGDLSQDAVQEVVMEAMAIFLQDDGGPELDRTIQNLHTSLSEEERTRALTDVVRIAEADGILLSSETNLITLLADQWDIKAMGRDLIAQSRVKIEAKPSWSLLHDLALLYVVVAHSADNRLSDVEVEAAVGRLGQWEPDLDEAEIRSVFREALAFYAKGPDQEALSGSVKAVKDAFPAIQRLALLDDLYFIAKSDGAINGHERSIIQALSQAWDLDVRFNGQHEAADS